MNDPTFRQALVRFGSRPQPVTLEWKDSSPRPGCAYSVTLRTVNRADGTARFTVSNTTQAVLVNLKTGCEYLWEVVRDDEPTRPARGFFKTGNEGFRLLYLPGVENARDLGGIRGSDGKHIRQGMILRSGRLNKLEKAKEDGDTRVKTLITPESIRELTETFSVRTELDLRSRAEVAGMTDSALGPSVRWINIPLRAYEWLRNDSAEIRSVFRILADRSSYPLLFHCSGGRDRAGSLAFLLRGVLGAADADLIADWDASALATADISFAPSCLNGLLQMLSAYDGGSISQRCVAFVRSCGVPDSDIDAFRSLLLEE